MSLVTEAQLRGVLLLAEAGLNEAQTALWESVRIEPEIWTGPTGQDDGFGVWVIARSGHEVIWLDAPSGKFRSGYFQQAGAISSPSCDLGELSEVLGV